MQVANLNSRAFVFYQSVEAYYNGDLLTTSELESSRQGWWARLCYNSPQAFAMDRYNNGFPGDSLNNAIYSLIPRILWPGKPAFSNLGVEFQQTYTGRNHDTTTSIGLGIFGEAYWLYGWTGVILICFAVGILIAVLTLVAVFHVSKGEMLLYLPCFFFGMMIARGIDRQIVMAFGGSIPIYFLLYVGNRVLCQILESPTPQFRQDNNYDESKEPVLQ